MFHQNSYSNAFKRQIRSDNKQVSHSYIIIRTGSDKVNILRPFSVLFEMSRFIREKYHLGDVYARISVPSESAKQPKQ